VVHLAASRSLQRYETHRFLLQSALVADAGYGTRWVCRGKPWRRAVELLTARAQRPLQLTGGPFYVISLETLLSVSN
jgi:hypothetical protein